MLVPLFLVQGLGGGVALSLLLSPALDLGVFVSYNSEGGEKARVELMDALLDRLYAISSA